MELLQMIPIMLLSLVVIADVIIGIFFHPPFTLTKMALIILSILFGSQSISLVVMGMLVWWIATFGGFAAVLALSKKPSFAAIAGSIIGLTLWVFRVVSPFGSAAMALAYPKFVYLVFEFVIFLPFVAMIFFSYRFIYQSE